jgi:GntR family transcriptional regulator / MocR family aminotransferase
MANSDRFSWSSSVELHLPPLPGAGLRAALEEALRDAIRSGRLTRGTPLPSTRALARDLGLSRGTVLGAYAQLAAEGWIAGRRGAGTVVAVDAATVTPAPAPQPQRRWRYDLRPGRPDATSFPRAAWLAALRRGLGAAPDDALGVGDPSGRSELRAELAGYLNRARGLRVSADDLLITTGFTQGLQLVLRALPPSRIAMENPCMPHHREIVRSAGHEIVHLDVDEDGARVEELGDARMVVLTPNRQHPLGVTLGAARRALLVDWARVHDAYVIEDDYDGEFRYDGHPIGPLQGLEPANVVHAGTVSKTLAPGVRLGWLAVPEALREAVEREKRLADWQNGVLEQLALTELLRSGAYDRHVRKMRLRYRRRRDVLLCALAGHTVHGAAAGLNLLLELPDVEAEQAVVDAAASRGVGVQGIVTSGYYADGGPAGVIIGYAAAPEHAFNGAVDAFLDALRTRSSAPRG